MKLTEVTEAFATKESAANLENEMRAKRHALPDVRLSGEISLITCN
jgi:hypothetical protein